MWPDSGPLFHLIFWFFISAHRFFLDGYTSSILSLFFFSPSRLAIIFSYKVNCSAIKDWYLAWKGLGMLDDFKIWLQSFNGSINYSLNWIIAKGEDKNFSGMLGFILQWYWPTLNITMWMNCSWFTLVDTEQCSEYIKIRCFCCTFAPS